MLRIVSLYNCWHLNQLTFTEGAPLHIMPPPTCNSVTGSLCISGWSPSECPKDGSRKDQFRQLSGSMETRDRACDMAGSKLKTHGIADGSIFHNQPFLSCCTQCVAHSHVCAQLFSHTCGSFLSPIQDDANQPKYGNMMRWVKSVFIWFHWMYI